MEIVNLEIKGNYSSTFCSVGNNIFFQVDVFTLLFLHNDQECYWPTTYRVGATITILNVFNLPNGLLKMRNFCYVSPVAK